MSASISDIKYLTKESRDCAGVATHVVFKTIALHACTPPQYPSVRVRFKFAESRPSCVAVLTGLEPVTLSLQD
jgi:hypothetical protein